MLELCRAAVPWAGFGRLEITVLEGRLVHVRLPTEPWEETAHWLAGHFPGADLRWSEEDLGGFTAQFAQYLSGERRQFNLPLDLRGTPFQQEVWQAVSEIPYGEIRSYGEVAARMGRPSACRATGAANGRNPLPLVIPCHRVVGSTGHLTGYGGGLELKAWLLRLEGAEVPRGRLGATSVA